MPLCSVMIGFACDVNKYYTWRYGNDLIILQAVTPLHLCNWKGTGTATQCSLSHVGKISRVQKLRSAHRKCRLQRVLLWGPKSCHHHHNVKLQ